VLTLVESPYPAFELWQVVEACILRWLRQHVSSGHECRTPGGRIILRPTSPRIAPVDLDVLDDERLEALSPFLATGRVLNIFCTLATRLRP